MLAWCSFSIKNLESWTHTCHISEMRRLWFNLTHMWVKCQAATKISHCLNSFKNAIEKIVNRNKFVIHTTHDLSLFLDLDQALQLKLPRLIKDAWYGLLSFFVFYLFCFFINTMAILVTQMSVKEGNIIWQIYKLYKHI